MQTSRKMQVHGEEKKPRLELPEPPALHDSTSSADNQHGNSSDMTKLAGDNTTSSYRFPQTLDVQMNRVVQRYDVDK
ncbi:hypothetical protein ARMSODRAFT_1026413 [Armillaria solidipes]|uniref:Uncharacterized protein n=1 Tax=Armillaria solidipes TaxID=1076256 RepID=A0A2H3BCA1_9AGAR|nr:hypothetical protein ARMSODRAFT_1026413 [Armillaria solidipes]